MSTKNFYSMDSYDKLFCKCDGVTTTFVDSSTANPKTITANGNATQLPIKFNKSAGFFNGTTDAVKIPNSSSFNFGTGNLTVEGFFMFNSVSGAQELWNLGTNGTSVNRCQLNGGHLYGYLGTSNYADYTWTPTVNTWYHIAMVRSGTGANELKLYVNAVNVASATNNSNVQTGSDINVLGAVTDAGSQFFSGWMKEFRVSNVARTITVPTTQYTTDANTVLLMHFDTPATSPLGPAIAFDGNGDKLTITHTSSQVIGTQDFDLSFYLRMNDVSSYPTVYDKNYTSADGMLLQYSSAKLKLWTGGVDRIVESTTAIANVWYKYQIKRVSGVMTMYRNDEAVGTYSAGTDNISTTVDAMIGYGTSTYYLNGCIREFSLTIGTTQVLYIKGDENNGVTTFLDSSTSPKTVTTAGDTKIKYTEDYRSCIFKDETGKFPYPVGSAKVDFFAIGSGVGYFDGTNSYLEIDDASDLDFPAPSGTTNDFAVEMYARIYTISTTAPLWSRETAGAISLRNSALGSYNFSLNNSTDVLVVSNGQTYLGWRHIALTRSGTTTRIFENGTLLGTKVDDTNDYSSAEHIWIGKNHTYYVNGRLDNIRISKGVARYTAAFNPPEFKRGGNKLIMWVN